MDPYLPLIASIVAALIAAAAAFVASVLTKETKISEFRQAWIDALREDISDLVGHVQLLAARLELNEDLSSSEVSAYLREIEPDVLTMNITATRIRLRLNPEEHVRLFKHVLSVTDEKSYGSLPRTQIFAKCEALEVEAQIVLRAAWATVKKGEVVFVATKMLLLGGMVVLAAGVIILGIVAHYAA